MYNFEPSSSKEGMVEIVCYPSSIKICYYNKHQDHNLIAEALLESGWNLDFSNPNFYIISDKVKNTNKLMILEKQLRKAYGIE